MTSDTQQLKKDLRKQALRQRCQIESCPDDIDHVIAHIETHVRPEEGQVLAGYWPINGELDITPLLAYFKKSGVITCLPVVQKDSLVLDFGIWDDETDFKTGAYGIQEPVIQDDSRRAYPDILLVPLLAFDRTGTRLGYGGGYYDKTLASLKERKSVMSVGIAYDQQICLFPLPKQDHDISLDWVMTPSKAYNFQE